MRIGQLLGLVGLFAGVLVLSPQDAAARSRSAQAERRQLIQEIKSQIATARSVLAQVESKGGLAAGQLEAARKKIAAAREALEAADAEETAAARAVRDIENDLIEAEGDDSEIARAKAAWEAAAKQYNELLFGRSEAQPADSEGASTAASSAESPSASTASGAPTDDVIAAAKQKLLDAKREYERLKTALREKDPQWVSDMETLREERKNRAEAAAKAGPNLSMLRSSRDLRSAKSIAAAARAVIAQGEARLRQLGVRPSKKPPPSSAGSSSSSSSH
jgi:DNA repair exonuclease SbcCD ATPase subunit